MAHVSLIVTATREDSPSAVELAAARRAIEAAGHSVEVIVARPFGMGPAAPAERDDASTEDRRGWKQVDSTESGRSSAAISGLQAAGGDLLLVLNPDRGHDPDELVRVLDALDPARADLVVASRLAPESDARTSHAPKAFLGRILRTLTGSSDPLSGLVGLSRPALEVALPRLEAVGTQFTLELLAKVPGRKRDIRIPARSAGTPGHRSRPRFDDVRHLKHLADHRFGNASRLLQFCIVGASGMVVDLTCYAIFQEIFFQLPTLAHNAVPPTRVPWALAISRALAIGVALVWNFSLNRRMTFSYARGGSILRQFVAYVLSNLLGVTVSLMLSLGLPSWVGFFHDHKLVAAVVGIVAATGISFSMSRWLVFRRVDPPAPAPSPRGIRGARHDSTLVEAPAGS